MQAEVRTLYHCGKFLTKKERDKEPPCRGKLQVIEDRFHPLNRVVTRAQLTSVTDGINSPLLPELLDVRIAWLEGKAIHLRGIEDIDGVMYAQEWEVRVS